MEIKDEIINNIYPLTVLKDRYGGSYSNGRFTAWNLEAYDVPEEVYGGDIECKEFWIANTIPVGVGSNLEEAVFNLWLKTDCSIPAVKVPSNKKL